MSESRNGSWNVGEVKWRMTRGGKPKVTHCSCRCYRLERNARNRFLGIAGSLSDQGFILSSIEPQDRDGYEGVQGCCDMGGRGRDSTVYVALYIDRNPE